MKETTFFTPGRVNLIGEHIDYNGGYVLPCCTPEMGTSAKLRKRGDNTARLTSANFPEAAAEAALDDIRFDAARGWANYPLGIVRMMQDDGRVLPGFGLHVAGNIPNGAGLSSSASLLVVTANALNTAFGLGYTMLELVLLAQRAENTFVGVNCGIMDQFAVGMGRPGHAIYLHCGTLAHKHVPMRLGEYAPVVMNTNKRRQLNESKYNERRAECEQALEILNKAVSGQHSTQRSAWKFLADMTPDEFVRNAAHLPDATLFKRARHVVTENARVKEAVAALEAGDVAALGALLDASHASLRDDYEVTGIELDTLVAEAQKHPACAGARMTGAGFGGCAVALVEKNAAAGFAEKVGAAYEKEIGYAAELYI